MSILQTFNTLNERYAPPTFARTDPPPYPVSDREDARWYDGGLDLLDSLLSPIRTAFKLGQATQKQRRGILGRIVSTGQAALRGVTGLLVGFKVTLAEWFRQMKREAMTRLYAGVAALLGPQDLPPVDREAVRAQAAVQMGLLDRFRREIAGTDTTPPVVRLKTRDGEPNGSVLVRAALYASAVWPVAVNVQRAVMIRAGYTEEKWNLSSADHCSGCPVQAARGFVPIGSLPNLGSQPCSVNCRCWLSYQ